MTATTAEPVAGQRGLLSSLIHRQLDTYPNTTPRIFYLALTVLATIMLYYELYVGGSVSTLILTNLNMSFTFYVLTLAIGNLIGAFGSLFAGISDRYGRANLVVFGLLFTGVFVAFVLPNATNKWVFTVEGFVVGVVEGICLVATPALIRDFSPQVGRASAMGFWTCGPVVGSLIVSVVGSNTVPAVPSSTRFWTHEYIICGIVGLVIFVVAFLFLRELSPRLRDQLMVSLHDRALIEARAKGVDIEAALKRPFSQLMKPDVVISALAVSVMLLIYYTAVGFLAIYLTTNFGFSLKDANGLGNWEWGFNVIALIAVGVVSDRLRVRKPFMVFGAIMGAIVLVFYIQQIGHHPSYYTIALILALLSVGLGIAYTPWMASFTETVEHRNPALIATGLAVWGWILRIIVFISFALIPVVINSVTPLVNYGSTLTADLAQYPALTWAGQHPQVVADAQQYNTELTFAAQNPQVVADAQRLAPELTVIQNNAALFTQAAQYGNNPPPALAAQLLAAAGGGAQGQQVLATIAANQAAIQQVIADSSQLTALSKVPQSVLAEAQQYSSELTALGKVPPAVAAYVTAHGADVQKAAAKTGGQWKNWYWICFGGIIFFLLSIPLLRGRWSPKAAKRDEEEYEAKVDAELAKLSETTA